MSEVGAGNRAAANDFETARQTLARIDELLATAAAEHRAEGALLPGELLQLEAVRAALTNASVRSAAAGWPGGNVLVAVAYERAADVSVRRLVEVLGGPLGAPGHSTT